MPFLIKYEYGNVESRDFIGDKDPGRLCTFWFEIGYEDFGPVHASIVDELPDRVRQLKEQVLARGHWFRFIDLLEVTELSSTYPLIKSLGEVGREHP